MSNWIRMKDHLRDGLLNLDQVAKIEKRSGSSILRSRQGDRRIVDMLRFTFGGDIQGETVELEFKSKEHRDLAFDAIVAKVLERPTRRPTPGHGERS